MKRENSTTVVISPPIGPIKTNQLKGERPFPNKTRVILFFLSTKPKLRDFERFVFILGDHGSTCQPIFCFFKRMETLLRTVIRGLTLGPRGCVVLLIEKCETAIGSCFVEERRANHTIDRRDSLLKQTTIIQMRHNNNTMTSIVNMDIFELFRQDERFHRFLNHVIDVHKFCALTRCEKVGVVAGGHICVGQNGTAWLRTNDSGAMCSPSVFTALVFVLYCQYVNVFGVTRLHRWKRASVPVLSSTTARRCGS